MGAVLLGVVVLVLAVFLLRAFIGADPKALIRALRYAGAGLLAAGAVGLFLADRPQVGVLLASMAWGVYTRGHLWPGGWPSYRFPSGRRSSSANASSVRSAWLEMALDHESGEMSGTVLKGAHAGRALAGLEREQLLALHTEIDDPESLRLLEAYLDRTLGADWRARGGPSQEQGESPPPERGRAGMTRAEALRVLGLEDGATEEDIRAAHRRLMLQNHPDRGGSDYLASKINEAKDVLLGA